MNKNFLLGNGLIALGLLEEGCQVITAYPGTPSSEIIPELVRLKKHSNLNTYIEWSINEKVAFDNAYAAAITGKRAACCMKQVGLNVASDSLMSSAYLGTKGGFIIISCDDPGPHSSQTEQDTRIMARLSKIPVFDPSLPNEARNMIKYAFEISEEFEIPVILRPTTRVCHTRELVKWEKLNINNKKATFKKNPTRWAATPKYRLKQHILLNNKLIKIGKKFNSLKKLNFHNMKTEEKYTIGIISSGVPFSIINDIFLEHNISNEIPILKLGTPYPLPEILVEKFLTKCEKILVIEETDSLIEYLIARKDKVFGRISNHVPTAGELTHEIIKKIIINFTSEFNLDTIKLKLTTNTKQLKSLKTLETLKIPQRKPTLCPGCPHRASFFAIRKSQPKAIFTSDIGCYTLGLNMGAVDTCVDMGAAITIASGLYQSFHQDNCSRQPIIATIGDSTFIHSGIPGLINSVYNNSRFLLVILDNSTIAMTGMQPSPPSGIRADGSMGNTISIEQIVKACGVNFIETTDPYNIQEMIGVVKKALAFTLKTNGEMAVIISRRPCLVAFKNKIPKNITIKVSNKCDNCNYCIEYFQCPALKTNKKNNSTEINYGLCTKCEVCIKICPKNAIEKI